MKNQEYKWRNLAPILCRQRVIIEATVNHLLDEDEIKDLMVKLSVAVEMQPLQKPFAYPAIKNNLLVGYGGWIHWITSGCHVYSYDKEWTENGLYLVSVDCYTCKPFSAIKAVEFVKSFLNAVEITLLEIS
jgi:hypothetical protein